MPDLNGIPVKTSAALPQDKALLLHPADVTDEMHCHSPEELERFRSLRCKAVTVISTAGQPVQDKTANRRRPLWLPPSNADAVEPHHTRIWPSIRVSLR